MANVPTVSWDETTPAGSEAISQGDNRIRELKTQIREVVDVDHDFPSSGQASDIGQHKQVTLQEQADLGTGAAGATILGSQTVSGKGELVYVDEDDNDVQLTDSGSARLPNLTDAQIWVGNGSNRPAGVAVSGDVALANDGSTTVTDFTITSEAEGDFLKYDGSNWVRTATLLLQSPSTDTVASANTNSTSYTDIGADVSFTQTAAGKYTIMILQGTIRVDAVDNIGYVALQIDSGTEVKEVTSQYRSGSSGDRMPFCIIHVATLGDTSAHNISGRYKVSAGNVYVYNVSLTVLEV